MEKFLNSLTKPAKWVLIIGGLFYAVWYAIGRGMSMEGSFMSVVGNILLLFVGTALIAIPPILVLFNKKELAKTVFLILVGYWLLTSIQNWLFNADLYCSNNDDGLAVVTGIFFFIGALGLLGILILIALEIGLKKPGFRFFAFLAILGVIVFAFFAGLFAFIEAIRYDWGWARVVDQLVEYILLPVVVCFGYLYFFGAPNKKGASEE